jgi:flagellar hook-associated protein 1 FlgK
MSVLLNNALTGLFAAQAGLRTTSNNTSNVNTVGYSRQRIDQTAMPGQSAGNLLTGNGVMVTGVQRIFDRFLVDQLHDASTLEQRYLAFNELAQRMDGVLGDTESGIAPAIQNFFDQLQSVAHDSTSLVNRQLLISQGASLEDRVNQFADQINKLDREIDRRVTDLVSSVNSISTSVARLNAQIVGGGNQAANDLLDQRDRLLGQLSELVDVRTIETSDGGVNVLIGNGRPLVLGTQSFDLVAVQDEFNPSRLQVAHVLGSRTEVISRQITGGTLGGLLSFRQEALDPAKRSLGMIAFGLTETFNQQHARGVDLNGNLGGDFFRSIQPIVTGSSANVGAGSLSASVADASAVQPRDYVLRFDGAAWQATDANTGALLSMSGTGTALDPFAIDGLEIVVAAAPAAGDQFLVRAVSEAAVSFGVAISDPATIAAASPIGSSYDFGNIGNAAISAPIVDDITNPALQQAIDIVFDDATTYRIYDGLGTDLSGPLAYTSGADIAFNGWRVQISGPAAAGDTFAIATAAAGSGDNGNAIALSGVRSRGFFDGGRTSVSDSIGNMVASVGGASFQSAQNLAAQGTLRQQLEFDVQNASGVNLDEEAVNALRYQEAFMASSRLIAMADDLFLSILNAVGR